MKAIKLFTAVSFLLFIITYTACKKTDSISNKPLQPTERFFTVPSDAPGQIKAIATALEKQNEEHHYLSSITKTAGYPRWDKARIVNFDKGTVSKGEDDVSGEIVYIPFVKDSDNYVNSLLAVKMDPSDTVYRMIHDYNYRKFGYDTTDHTKWSARDVFNLFASFDNSVFGHTRFIILDGKLFGRDTATGFKVELLRGYTKPTARVSLMQQVEECNDYSLCLRDCSLERNAKVSIVFCCSVLNVSVCTSYWIDTGGGSGSGGSTGGTTGTGDGTGGSGGGSGWYSGGGDPCPGPIPIEKVSTNIPLDGCGSGWTRVPTNNTAYNPYKADSVKVDTSITNSFPCLIKILDTLSSYGNLNQKAQLALSQIFGVNKYIHTTIQLDRSLVGSNTSAYTRRTGSTPIGAGDTAQLDFFATVYLNPDMLINGTKEYIASTIVHEAMHAYIEYNFTLYHLNYVDSDYVKSKFPLFWGKISPYSRPTEIQEHNLMASNWIRQISEPLYAFTNNDLSPSMKDSIYRSIGWGGLEDTDLFKLKTDKCNIMAINIAARNKNQSMPFTINGYPECTTHYNVSAASLKLKSLCD